MKRFDYKKYLTGLLIALVTLGISNVLSGCGSTRSYWGVENEYYWGDGGHHHHKPPKPKKYKKHKKHKHHKHHDHDDDDD